MDTADQIVNKILKIKGLKGSEFSRIAGFKTPQAVYDIRAGKTKSLTRDAARRISDAFPDLNLNWILTGEGDMLKKGYDSAEDCAAHGVCEEAASYGVAQSIYAAPLLPMSAMGGGLSGFAADGVKKPDCEVVISPVAGVDFAITVYGESMSPEYPSGSRVLIKKIRPEVFIDWGRVYVLDTSNGVIVKEVHQSEKEGCITCYSINPDPKYRPFEVPFCEIFGMYRVLMCLSAK